MSEQESLQRSPNHVFAIGDYWHKEERGFWWHCLQCHQIFLASEQMLEHARKIGKVIFPQKEMEVWRYGERDFTICSARCGVWNITAQEAMALLTELEEHRETMERLAKEQER